MEIDVNEEKICINKLICEKKELIFTEEDMIVPDSKPDILNTVNITGNVCIAKKEVQDGSVKIEGTVNTYIMYIPDSQTDRLRGLNATINFSKLIPIKEAKDGMEVVTSSTIKDLECKVINGRKINVKAGIEISLKLFSNEEVRLINQINNIKSVQSRQENAQINSFIGKGSTRVYVKDTFGIAQEDEILDVLKTEINLVNADTKISYNKILAKCEVDVKIMYLTAEGKINSVSGRIPAVGFIDMQNVTEESICDVTTEIKNILIRPNSKEEHSIYIEIELEPFCMCYASKRIDIIQDLYSPTVDLEFSKRNINMISRKETKEKSFTLTSKTSVEDLAEGNLIDVNIVSSINKEKITDSNITYEGELTLLFIFENNNRSINSKSAKIPFETSVDNPCLNENIGVETQSVIKSKKIDIKNNGDVECNIDMEILSNISQNSTIDIIENIEVTENRVSGEDYDSLIIYVVMPGDTLWKIAKRFRSTVEDIATLNGIEDENKIEVGQKIYIPKFMSLVGA